MRRSQHNSATKCRLCRSLLRSREARVVVDSYGSVGERGESEGVGERGGGEGGYSCILSCVIWGRQRALDRR
jgi:hypothetical protein